MSKHNQFIIIISPNTQWCDYLELVEACGCLNGAALKLYIYLSSFVPGEEIDFSPKMFCEMYNVSASSEKNAFRELLEKNFLKTTKKENIFLFSTNKK